MCLWPGPRLRGDVHGDACFTVAPTEFLPRSQRIGLHCISRASAK